MDYHITIGTYGTRLHGGERPTVDRFDKHQYGEEFLERDAKRELFARDKMTQRPVYLTQEQRQFVENVMPDICQKGKWLYHIAACQVDHLHLLVSSDVEPKKIRRWLKQWLTMALNDKFGKRQWLAEFGSTKYLFEEGYFEAVYEYIKAQRITQ